ncbi:MAG TPA: hypothetical protein PLI87_11355, partial [bacterium]|nr:hypothetical protein [bacterium]
RCTPLFTVLFSFSHSLSWPGTNATRFCRGHDVCTFIAGPQARPTQLAVLEQGVATPCSKEKPDQRAWHRTFRVFCRT